MRYWAFLAALCCLSACSSGASDSATLVLNDPFWDQVNVEVVITKSSDCDNRGSEYLSTKTFEMHKDRSESIDAPNGDSVCWRHDRNPKDPVPGAWSGWSRATLFPGQTTETDL